MSDPNFIHSNQFDLQSNGAGAVVLRTSVSALSPDTLTVDFLSRYDGAKNPGELQHKLRLNLTNHDAAALAVAIVSASSSLKG